MNIWLPNPLYQFFPLLYVLVGFFVVVFLQNPLGILIAMAMYIYSYYIMWMRSSTENE